jgi:hypothetical protein
MPQSFSDFLPAGATCGAGSDTPLAPNDVDATVDAAAAADGLLTWSVAGDGVIMHRLLGRVLRERDRASGTWTQTVSTTLTVIEPRLFVGQAWSLRVDGARLA